MDYQTEGHSSSRVAVRTSSSLLSVFDSCESSRKQQYCRSRRAKLRADCGVDCTDCGTSSKLSKFEEEPAIELGKSLKNWSNEGKSGRLRKLHRNYHAIMRVVQPGWLGALPRLTWPPIRVTENVTEFRTTMNAPDNS